MPIVNDALAAGWSLQPGEVPCPAHEAANALADLISEAAEDAEPIFAQLKAAPDATPEALLECLRLRQLLVRATVRAQLLVDATTRRPMTDSDEQTTAQPEAQQACSRAA